jgi:hypothetical protein
VTSGLGLEKERMVAEAAQMWERRYLVPKPAIGSAPSLVPAAAVASILLRRVGGHDHHRPNSRCHGSCFEVVREGVGFEERLRGP